MYEIHCPTYNKMIKDNDECINCPKYDDCPMAKPYPMDDSTKNLMLFFMGGSLIIGVMILYLLALMVEKLL